MFTFKSGIPPTKVMVLSPADPQGSSPLTQETHQRGWRIVHPQTLQKEFESTTTYVGGTCGTP